MLWEMAYGVLAMEAAKRILPIDRECRKDKSLFWPQYIAKGDSRQVSKTEITQNTYS